MKTTFQKMLSNRLREQSGMDILQDLPDLTKTDDELQPTTADSTGKQLPPPPGVPPPSPAGSILVDTNGNGVWDEGEAFCAGDCCPNCPEGEGTYFYPETILITNPAWPDCGDCPQYFETIILTWTYGGQAVAFINEQWQAIVENSDGDSVLCPDIWALGGGMWVHQTAGPNGPIHWITWDDPWTDPSEWWNPQTDQILQGSYPAWALELGWEVGDFAGNIPLIPFGEYGADDLMPIFDGDFNQENIFRLSVTVHGEDPAWMREFYGNCQNAFGLYWTWYFNAHGNYPPESSWPTDAPWWDRFWSGPSEGGPFGARHNYEEWLKNQ